MRQPQLLLLAEDDAIELRDRGADQLDRVGLRDQCGNGVHSPLGGLHARRCATSALTACSCCSTSAICRWKLAIRACTSATISAGARSTNFLVAQLLSLPFEILDRLRLALLQTRQLRRRVIDQPGERRGDRALLDAGSRRRRQLRARPRRCCSSAILPTALITLEAGGERVLVVRVGRLVVDHNFATLRNIELAADLPRAEDRGLDGGDVALGGRVAAETP